MGDLISRSALREEWLENGENEYVYDTNAFLESIDAQPTVEAEPVVHGEWKEDKFGFERSICSVCRTVFEGNDWNYCPNCGAKMDGGV